MEWSEREKGKRDGRVDGKEKWNQGCWRGRKRLEDEVITRTIEEEAIRKIRMEMREGERYSEN